MASSMTQPFICWKTQWDQSIGPPLSPSAPASLPGKVILNGKTVTLEPLDRKHAIDLWPQVRGDERGYIWTYMSDEPYQSLDDFQQAVTTKSQYENMVFFAIIHNETKKPVGWACYMRIDIKNRVLEVGNVLFSPSSQRTKAATEAIYIMAKHVFEDLSYRRYEWKCDNHNGPSKRAALRFGFTFEGVFRQHIIYKGRSRDTAWFSMIDTEWPLVKQGFEAWLDDKNFEEDGKQIRRLEDLRKELSGKGGFVDLE